MAKFFRHNIRIINNHVIEFRLFDKIFNIIFSQLKPRQQFQDIPFALRHIEPYSLEVPYLLIIYWHIQVELAVNQ